MTGGQEVSAAAAAAAAGVVAGTNRLHNTTVCLPLVYGSVAFFLGKKADEYHTHKWTLYLRGPNHEDLGVCIQKVIFQLHPSFAQPCRELTEPPFEVTERGWGEFEAQIRIVWKDSSEKPTVVNHGIKLYPPGSPTTNMQPTKEPVIDEVYDEVVFTDPKESFFQSLIKVSQVPKIVFPDDAVQACLAMRHFSDEHDMQSLLTAQQFLQKELQQVKARIKLVSDEMEQVDAALKDAMEAKKAVRHNINANNNNSNSNSNVSNSNSHVGNKSSSIATPTVGANPIVPNVPTLLTTGTQISNSSKAATTATTTTITNKSTATSISAASASAASSSSSAAVPASAGAPTTTTIPTTTMGNTNKKPKIG